MVEALTEAAEARSVRFEFATAARSLLLHPDGELAGVRAKRGGRTLDVRCGAVILASGGFQGNDEMMARYVERAAYVPWPIATRP